MHSHVQYLGADSQLNDILGWTFILISDRATPCGAAGQIYRHERDGSAGSK